MSFLQMPPLERLLAHPPVILVGMHRSGTSLLVRLLEQLGLYLGYDQGTTNAESRHFQRLNKRTLRAAGGGWNDPEPVLDALQSDAFVERWAAHYRTHIMRGISGVRYWGAQTWFDLLRGGELPALWGWKDPRTSLTLDIWLRVFPEAHVVHIIRNGIDVAVSLHRRQLAQQKRWRVHPDHRDPRGLDFEYCFTLWEHYQRHLLTFRESVNPAQYTEFHYETLLREPEPTLRILLERIGLVVSDDQLAQTVSMINTGRLDNRAYAAAYHDYLPKMRAHPLMVALGYGESTTNDDTSAT